MPSTNNANSPVSIFVGIGIATYQNREKYPSLGQAVPDVKGVSEILAQEGYKAHVFLDRDLKDSDLMKELGEILGPDKFPHSSLVILWSGHGEPANHGGLKLIARNTGPKPQGTTPTAATVAEMAALTGANQILFIFDTCYSGEALFPAAEVTAAVLNQYPPDAEQVWFGVIASALAFERAKDGAFGSRLLKLLREGPLDGELRRRWSPNNQRLRGDDLIDALKKEWDIPNHVPDLLSKGDAGYMLPNPLFVRILPGRMDSHLLEAALGGEPGDKRCYFAGRVSQLNQIVDRMKNGKPGAFAIAGPPGAGKSAILGRIVSLSDKEERARLLALGALEHADPGEGSVSAHVYALRFTPEGLAAEIDNQLVRNGFLPPDADGPRTWDQLPGAIQQTGKCPVIAVDGLNESQSCWRIAEDVLRTLGEVSTVLVSTQDLPPADGPLPLLKTFGAKEVIDLGAIELVEQTEDDVRRYVQNRLAGADTLAMDLHKIADRILEVARDQDSGAFLVARFISTQLRQSPVDTSLPDWQEQLAHSIEKTFESFLAGLPKLRQGPLELPNAARDLMEALAWARGPGLPDDIWPIMATASSGTKYDRSSVRWLLNYADDYIIEDGQGGRAVYRPVHQWLADYFRTARPGTSGFDERAIRIAGALVDYYERLLAAGQPPQMSAYLWRYAWLHCADAGLPGIEIFRRLVVLDSKIFDRQLARALSLVSKKLGARGSWREALEAAREVAGTYKRLAEADPKQRTDLAEALSTQAWLQVMVKPDEASEPAQQAIDLFKQMDTANPAVGLPLASSLTVLSLCNVMQGRLTETLQPAIDAVALLRQLSKDNPAFGPELAHALTALGIGLYQMGQAQKAVDTVQEALNLFGDAKTDNPLVQIGSAWATQLLGLSYSQLGRAQEAVDASRRAVDLVKALPDVSSATELLLGSALTALGLSYVQAGQPKEAVAAAAEAIELFADMDTSNASVCITHATALTVLGQAFFQVGQAPQAIGATRKAADLLKSLDISNPVISTILASALSSLAQGYLQGGQVPLGIQAALEATEVIRHMDLTNAGVGTQLALALTALSQGYIQTFNPQEGVKTAQEAVDLFRTLNATNPSAQFGLACALMLLGVSHSQLGSPDAAVDASREAVDLFRQTPDTIAAKALLLASALGGLGLAYTQIGKSNDAISATAEAADLFGTMDSSLPSVALPFASALAVMGQGYCQTERGQDAEAAARKAIEILASQDASNPTMGPLHALALSVLGQASLQTQHFDQGIDAFKKSLAIYRGLTQLNAKLLESVAETLVLFDKCCREADREDELDAQWQASSDGFDGPEEKASLLMRRAATRGPQIAMAVLDLLAAQSLVASAKNRALVAELHQASRSIRASAPEGFDAAWQNSGGESLPAWLTLEQASLDTLLEWYDIKQPDAQKTFLAEHIARLKPEFDSVAFDEIALRLPDSSDASLFTREWELFRLCLKSSREQGIDEAYRPVFAYKLLLSWLMESDVEKKFSLLRDRRKDLLDDAVEKVLQSLREQFSEDPDIVVHQSVLDLARLDKENLALDLLNDVNRAPAALLTLAGAGDSQALYPLATILIVKADTQELRALGGFYSAVALAMEGEPDRALEALVEACLLDPKKQNEWLALLFQCGGPHRDRLIPISQALLAPQTPKADP